MKAKIVENHHRIKIVIIIQDDDQSVNRDLDYVSVIAQYVRRACFVLLKFNMASLS